MNADSKLERCRQWAWALACVPVALLLLLIGLPFFLLILTLQLTRNVVFLIGLWAAWAPRGVDTLVVYSDSPHWREYFLESMIPAIGPRGVTLNWSERKQWPRLTWRSLAFRWFAGRFECNPAVVIFKPFKPPRTFGFYRAMSDAKHNNFATIRKVLIDLEKALGQPVPAHPKDPRQSP